MGKNMNHQNYKNLLTSKKTKSVATKLPKTGIEQPMLRERPRFKETCREFEPVHQFNVQMAEEYARMDAEKLISNQI